MQYESRNCKKKHTFPHKIKQLRRLTGALPGFILPYMKIINRYFTKQLAMIFIMLLLVLTGLAWMLQIMSLMKFLINYGVDLSSFLGLTALMIPFIVSIIIPFVTFIAIIFVYNKMIGDNEVTVMAASTLSPRQIAHPALMMGLVLTCINWGLNTWIVPKTQAQFYDTQWELRYGMAHMKLQEAAFSQITRGLVVYVDKVAGHDLSQLILSDTRNANSKMTIFAEKGKLVSTSRGLSIVMSNGSLQARDNSGLTIGTFDTFDMDLNVADKEGVSTFKARRISTINLIKSVAHQESPRQHKLILSELCTRLLTPLMNIILAALCTMILLRSSLLRRRTSFAPMAAVGAMAATMALYMSATNMITSLTGFGLLALAQILLLAGILFALFRK